MAKMPRYQVLYTVKHIVTDHETGTLLPKSRVENFTNKKKALARIEVLKYTGTNARLWDTHDNPFSQALKL